jgi:hypothetical protein
MQSLATHYVLITIYVGNEVGNSAIGLLISLTNLHRLQRHACVQDLWNESRETLELQAASNCARVHAVAEWRGKLI